MRQDCLFDEIRKAQVHGQTQAEWDDQCRQNGEPAGFSFLGHQYAMNRYANSYLVGAVPPIRDRLRGLASKLEVIAIIENIEKYCQAGKIGKLGRNCQSLTGIVPIASLPNMPLAYPGGVKPGRLHGWASFLL